MKYRKRTLDEWRQLAASGTRGYSDNQLDDIAAKCLAADQANENPSVWHMAAMVGGHKCQCAKCNPYR